MKMMETNLNYIQREWKEYYVQFYFYIVFSIYEQQSLCQLHCRTHN